MNIHRGNLFRGPMSGVVWAPDDGAGGGGGSIRGCSRPLGGRRGRGCLDPIIVPRRFDTRLDGVVRLVQPRIIRRSRSCGNSGGGNAASDASRTGESASSAAGSAGA